MKLNLTLLRAVLFVALAHGTAPVLAAQENMGDPRWLAWLGCWEPADSTAQEQSALTLMCVVPAAGQSAAEIVRVTNGVIESRERVNASREPEAREREGCRSQETAAWSPDGMRLYLTSEYACPGEPAHRGSGVLSIAPGGDWLDVRGLATGERRGVSVVRYREAFPAAAEIPEEIRLALEGLDGPRKTARQLAEGRLFATSVIEAAQRLDAPVVEAWLLERGLGFTVNRRDLLEMEEAGVPMTVIDLVVGLSYPGRFAVNQARRVERIPPQVARGHDGYDYPYYYGSYYGYGWYPGDGPVVVVVADPGPQAGDEHGSVVKGKGYKKGDSSSSSTSTGTDGGRRTESSSSSSSTSSSESSSSSPNSSERTAKPRP